MSSREDLQEEAGILALACAQIGNELAQGRLAVAADAQRKLSAILKKLAALEVAASNSAAVSEPAPGAPAN